MNDRHPSGTLTPTPASDADHQAHHAPYGTQEAQHGDLTSYGGYDTGAFPTDGQGTATFAADPLFGNLPGDATGGYDASAWSTGGQQILNHDPYAAPQHTGYDTGGYETTSWSADQQLSAIPPQTGGSDVSGQWETPTWLQTGGAETSGQWDAPAWLQPDASGGPADQTQQWEWGTQAFDTGAYDATGWNSDGSAPDEHDAQATAVFEQVEQVEQHDGTGEFAQADPFGYASYDEPGADGGESADPGAFPSVGLLGDQEEVTSVPGGRAASRAASRSRRRPPPKRSALLTIAVPSACVMGVAGIAAASVGTFSGDSDTSTTATASDAHPVKPSAANNKLDNQLRSLSDGADDFRDRASRTQERIDLKAEQAAEQKKAAAEAARKERLRPKYALPVAQRGLSAYFGQAGVNWMSVHTGIDFPVSYGTSVMAATDGTARTQWNSAYGNMMIVTAKDGTETWYCHLSSYRVASGTTVKAGDPIAYSGNSGNSTGPHLHFEVRPAGGSAIDPLPWLRSHDLDPT
ncbi:M23 family metallopeptidase [Streptomyces sp. NPDC087294]|uniref:M23 family metallopeptidase n=1 Tax=Streptomyces sp. NPDC087294 TaxID=3365777 RepID=UPI003810E838